MKTRETYKLHYGFDPDTDKHAMYLWNVKTHRIVCKLLCNPFAKRYWGGFVPQNTL